MIRQLAEHDHLPDYQVAFDDKADMVVFTNRGTMSPAPLIEGNIPPLQSDTYEEARQACPWMARCAAVSGRRHAGETGIVPGPARLRGQAP